MRLWLLLWAILAPGAAGAVGEGRSVQFGVFVPDLAACRELASISGARPEADFHYEEIAGGHHHERDWAARFDRVVTFLMGDREVRR
jgi:hypothetical protein